MSQEEKEFTLNKEDFIEEKERIKAFLDNINRFADKKIKMDEIYDFPPLVILTMIPLVSSLERYYKNILLMIRMFENQEEIKSK